MRSFSASGDKPFANSITTAGEVAIIRHPWPMRSIVILSEAISSSSSWIWDLVGFDSGARTEAKSLDQFCGDGLMAVSNYLSNVRTSLTKQRHEHSEVRIEGNCLAHRDCVLIQESRKSIAPRLPQPSDSNLLLCRSQRAFGASHCEEHEL